VPVLLYFTDFTQYHVESDGSLVIFINNAPMIFPLMGEEE